MRTNILLDDELVQKAMAITGLKTKKDVVEKALREYVDTHTRKDLSELRGTIEFADGYDYRAMREGL